MSQAQFDKAVSIIRAINEEKGSSIKLERDEKLTFYKYFRQATDGDNTTKRPSLLNIVERFKWDAWAEAKGLSKAEATSKYVEHYFATLKKRENNEEAKRDIAEVEALA